MPTNAIGRLRLSGTSRPRTELFVTASAAEPQGADARRGAPGLVGGHNPLAAGAGARRDRDVAHMEDRLSRGRG